MSLPYRFNSFDFVTPTIFSKSSATLLIALLFPLFSAFSSRNFDMSKFISPRNLKRSKLGSLVLNQKILKLCFLNILLFLFHHLFFMISFINLNNNLMIFKPNIWLLNFLLSTIFSLWKSLIIFSAIDVSSQNIMSSWLYPNLFLNSMASGNLQCSIISRVSFSMIKVPVSASDNALYFCFSSSVMLFVFLPHYFLILFKATSQIFECFICVLTSLTFSSQFNYILLFIVMLHCFNNTFSPCFFCNFYNHFMHTKDKIIFYTQ